MFDITKYKWNSDRLEVHAANSEYLHLEDTNVEWVQMFNKDDSIAISQHFYQSLSQRLEV